VDDGTSAVMTHDTPKVHAKQFSVKPTPYSSCTVCLSAPAQNNIAMKENAPVHSSNDNDDDDDDDSKGAMASSAGRAAVQEQRQHQRQQQ
jgi:hypothetical protein